MHAVVAEPLAHGAAGEGRQELQRSRLRRRGRDHDRVVQRAALLERFDDLGDGRAVLADGDVDAIELLALVGRGVDRLHVQDAVADGEHLTDVGDVDFLAEVGDLRLEDGRDLGGADIHGAYALLRANFRESSFDFSEASNRREPTCTLMPPRMAGSTRVSISGSLPSAWRSAAARPLDWAGLSGRAVVTWAETAPRAL